MGVTVAATHITVSCATAAAGGALGFGSLLALAAEDADNVIKCLFDIDAVLGRGLNKLAAELAGEGVALLRRHLAFGDAIALVADEHDGDGQLRSGGGYGGTGIRRGGSAGLLDTLDLVVEALDARKRGARGDAVNEYEALAVTNPLVTEGRVFFLASGVEDFEHAGLGVDDDLLSVLVLNCRIILGEEQRISEIGVINGHSRACGCIHGGQGERGMRRTWARVVLAQNLQSRQSVGDRAEW